jgi:hypothetical protein
VIRVQVDLPVWQRRFSQISRRQGVPHMGIGINGVKRSCQRYGKS